MDKLENYKDLKALGKGAYGAVNLVQYTPTGKQYAMKVIPLGKLDQY